MRPEFTSGGNEPKSVDWQQISSLADRDVVNNVSPEDEIGLHAVASTSSVWRNRPGGNRIGSRQRSDDDEWLIAIADAYPGHERSQWLDCTAENCLTPDAEL
ncbi:hypothetical protein [Mycobacterium kubicae]|uniref:hypothetical protein n=1 Tax=Mycobacterium kubicae TaxID=120959 RepID=UPI0013F4DB30|nr:hypothetical protein [Mycobacterium kubicae]